MSLFQCFLLLEGFLLLLILLAVLLFGYLKRNKWVSAIFSNITTAISKDIKKTVEEETKNKIDEHFSRRRSTSPDFDKTFLDS